MSIKSIAPKFPIQVDLGEGIVPIREDNLTEVVKFQLKNLLLTRPGEKLSDPDFGIGLSNFLFSQHNLSVPAIKSRIQQQINKYCNYFDSLDVKVAISGTSDIQITVNIRFVITEFKVKDEIEVTV
jgi:phage baseplate assembly protein W